MAVIITGRAALVPEVARGLIAFALLMRIAFGPLEERRNELRPGLLEVPGVVHCGDALA